MCYSIVGFDLVSPNGVVTSELLDDDLGRTGVKYIKVYWTPSATQVGAETICFMATDSNGRSRWEHNIVCLCYKVTTDMLILLVYTIQ